MHSHLVEMRRQAWQQLPHELLEHQPVHLLVDHHRIKVSRQDVLHERHKAPERRRFVVADVRRGLVVADVRTKHQQERGREEVQPLAVPYQRIAHGIRPQNPPQPRLTLLVARQSMVRERPVQILLDLIQIVSELCRVNLRHKRRVRRSCIPAGTGPAIVVTNEQRLPNLLPVRPRHSGLDQHGQLLPGDRN